MLQTLHTSYHVTPRNARLMDRGTSYQLPATSYQLPATAMAAATAQVTYVTLSWQPVTTHCDAQPIQPI